MVRLLCLLLVLLSGCSQETYAPKKKEVQTQACEMCGHVWEVYAAPGEQVPPTIKWCLHDSNFCQTGFGLFLDTTQKGILIHDSPELVEHCRKCKGCRCAIFEPEDWYTLVSQE